MKYLLLSLILLMASCTSPVAPDAGQQEEITLQKEIETWLKQNHIPIKKKVPDYNSDLTDLRNKDQFYPLIEIEMLPMHLDE